MIRTMEAKFRNGLSLVLGVMLLAVSLTACSSRPTGTADSSGKTVVQNPAERFGAENYNADPAVLSYETIDGIGDGVVYREPAGLEQVIARSPEVILLTIVEPGQPVLHQLQPWLEQLAADEAGSLIVILATTQATDPFLLSFEQAGWPSFFLIQKAAVKLSLYGFDETNQRLIKESISTLSK